MKATIATVLAVAGAVGCGGGGGSHADPVPFEDFPARSAESACGYFLECCNDAELMSIFSSATMPPSTVAECQALFQPQLETVFGTTLRDALDSGRIEWDGQAAGDCFAEHASLACGELTMGPASAACSMALRGTVVDGGACTSPLECASQTCNMTSHTCIARPRLGESCTATGSCEAGAFCRSDGAGNETCVTLAADGDPCTTGSECAHGNCTAGHCAVPMTLCDGR